MGIYVSAFGSDPDSLRNVSVQFLFINVSYGESKLLYQIVCLVGRILVIEEW